MQTLYLILSYRIGYHPTRLPRWRSGHAVDCRSTTLRFKSGPWLSEMCVSTSTRRRTAKQFFDQVDQMCPPSVTKHLKQTTCGDCGHSCRETPGLIPNPAVKLTHVVCCTEVRESPGTIPSCNHLPSYTVSLLTVFSLERMLSASFSVIFILKKH